MKAMPKLFHGDGRKHFARDLLTARAAQYPYPAEPQYQYPRTDGGPIAAAASTAARSVYIAFEGAEGFKARAEAFRRTHAIKAKVPFFLIGTQRQAGPRSSRR